MANQIGGGRSTAPGRSGAGVLAILEQDESCVRMAWQPPPGEGTDPRPRDPAGMAELAAYLLGSACISCPTNEPSLAP